MAVSIEKVISIQRDMAVDQKEEIKAGKIRCVTSAFRKSSFIKTLRNRNLQALELPAPFVKEHGHYCKTTVLLQGPSGHSKAVQLIVKSYDLQDRVHFRGAGWRAFVLGNGLKVGHQLVFSLISDSTFSVRHCPGAANAKTQTSGSRSDTSKRCNGIMSRVNLLEMRNHYKQLARQLVEVGTRNVTDKLTPPSVAEFHVSNTIANKVPESHVSHVKGEVIYPRGTRRSNRGFDMLVERRQCPRFVTTIRKSYLSKSLSVPAEFCDKYGMYFSERVNTFQGPTGRAVEVCFSRTRKLHFTTGWNAFFKENNLKVGDVLLFSLQAPACWWVRVVESHESS